MCTSKNNSRITRTSRLTACLCTLLGIFSLCVSLPIQADEQEAAVATADASVDSIIDHTINTQGLSDAKSVSQSDGAVILRNDNQTVQVVKKPDQKISPKKSEVVKADQKTSLTIAAQIK